MAKYSKYNLKKDLNITYLLGAGASYNSVPIWSEQASSMLHVADKIDNAIKNPKSVFKTEIMESSRYDHFDDNEIKFLETVIEDLKYFAEKADTNGTIDSYANLLHKRNRKVELNRLKKTLSVYLDIWQFYVDYMPFRATENNPIPSKQVIDTRYIQWLNMITESDQYGEVSLKKEINVLSWNYDLQGELAFINMYQDESIKCLDDINRRFRFLENLDETKQDMNIHHLNGHSGYFKYESKDYTTAKNFLKSNLYTYLKDLYDNVGQFKIRSNNYHDYGAIKFSWEKELSDKVRNIASRTDILVIIGYSFPQYNRIVDRIIIDLVKANSPLYIYYQDPNSNLNRVSSFIGFENLEHDRSTMEFFVPDEHINPREAEIVI